MNALTRSAATALPRASAQFRSAVQRRHGSSGTFTQDWLSDPSTYPIIGILTIAVSGCTAFMTYKITRCPDVRIGKTTKGQVVRTWHS